MLEVALEYREAIDKITGRSKKYDLRELELDDDEWEMMEQQLRQVLKVSSAHDPCTDLARATHVHRNTCIVLRHAQRAHISLLPPASLFCNCSLLVCLRSFLTPHSSSRASGVQTLSMSSLLWTTSATSSPRSPPICHSPNPFVLPPLSDARPATSIMGRQTQAMSTNLLWVRSLHCCRHADLMLTTQPSILSGSLTISRRLNGRRMSCSSRNMKLSMLICLSPRPSTLHKMAPMLWV